jgi:phage gp45-like
MKKSGDIDVTCKTLTVKATSAINLKADKEVQINGQQEVGVKSLKVLVNGTTEVGIKGLKVEVKGDVSAKVEAVMLDLTASGIASLKGSLTKIG